MESNRQPTNCKHNVPSHSATDPYANESFFLSYMNCKLKNFNKKMFVNGLDPAAFELQTPCPNPLSHHACCGWKIKLN